MGGVRVKANGPLFSQSYRPLLKPAVKAALEYGKSVIQSNTPVLTGNLRKNWTYETRRNTITNLTPYADYVENGTRRFRGRGMIAQSIGSIEAYFIQAVEEQVKKLGG